MKNKSVVNYVFQPTTLGISQPQIPHMLRHPTYPNNHFFHEPIINVISLKPHNSQPSPTAKNHSLFPNSICNLMDPIITPSLNITDSTNTTQLLLYEKISDQPPHTLTPDIKFISNTFNSKPTHVKNPSTSHTLLNPK